MQELDTLPESISTTRASHFFIPLLANLHHFFKNPDFTSFSSTPQSAIPPSHQSHLLSLVIISLCDTFWLTWEYFNFQELMLESVEADRRVDLRSSSTLFFNNRHCHKAAFITSLSLFLLKWIRRKTCYSSSCYRETWECKAFCTDGLCYKTLTTSIFSVPTITQAFYLNHD